MKRRTVVSTSGAAILLVGVLAAVQPAGAGTQCFGEEATKTIGSGASGDVYGTQGDDVIVGTIGHEASVVVRGRDGDDRICVNSPGAALRLEGGEGRDKMKGNRASFEGGPGGDRIIDWIGSGYAEGGLGNDRITDTGGSGDFFYGQSGDDYLDVSPHRGYAFGGPGTDTCVGNPLKTEGCENP